MNRKLNHPNIVGFRGVKKTSDGLQALVMEDCHISLGNILEERHENEMGPLPANHAMQVCCYYYF